MIIITMAIPVYIIAIVVVTVTVIIAEVSMLPAVLTGMVASEERIVMLSATGEVMAVANIIVATILVTMCIPDATAVEMAIP